MRFLRSITAWGRRHTAVAVLCLFASAYLTFSNGRIVGSDAQSMFNVTRSIVLQASVSVPSTSPAAVRGYDGRHFSKYGIAKSLVNIPGAEQYLTTSMGTNVPDLWFVHLYHLGVPVPWIAATLAFLLALGGASMGSVMSLNRPRDDLAPGARPLV